MRSLFVGAAFVCALACAPEARAQQTSEVDARGAETFYSHEESREKRRSKVTAGWRLTTSPHD